MNIRQEQKLYKEAQQIAKKFLNHPKLIDIELGLKHKNGELTDELSLRFKVSEKVNEKNLKKSEILPKKIANFKTDVLKNVTFKQNSVRIEDPTNIIRPLIGGIQIQSEIYKGLNNWGTLGCYYEIQNQVFGFTNYHVLYGGVNENIVLNNYVERLSIFQNLNNIYTKVGIASKLFSKELDYAIFSLQVPIDILQSVNMIPGVIDSYVYPQIRMPLIKSGAKTKITYGIIDGKSCFNNSELSIHIDNKYHNTNDIISDYGDSGSVWCLNNSSNMLKLVALHYGGGETPIWAKAKSFSSILASIRNKIQNQNFI